MGNTPAQKRQKELRAMHKKKKKRRKKKNKGKPEHRQYLWYSSVQDSSWYQPVVKPCVVTRADGTTYVENEDEVKNSSSKLKYVPRRRRGRGV